MRNSLTLTLLVAAFAAIPTALAQSPGAGGAVIATTPGKGMAVSTAEISAPVTAVDKANRLITLKNPKGESVSFVAGPDVRNFDQIKVGDVVRVQYGESLVLELKKGGKALVARSDQAVGARAKAGAKPGALVGREVKIVADVIDVDRAAQAVTLRGPKRTVTLKIADPEQLKLIEKGDQVEATFTEAVAVSVTAAK